MAINEARGGEDGKGKIMWKVKVSCKKMGQDGWPDEQCTVANARLV